MDERPTMTIGTMVSRGGLSWDLTDADALWLARAIVGESTRDAHAVGSTMLRRLAYVSDARGRAQWPSLTALLIGDADSAGYSQPVAVQWRERGPAELQARRARIRSLSWEAIPEHVRATVLALFTGARLSMGGAVHFADSRVSASYLAQNPGSVIVGRGANTFIAQPGSRSYAEPTITPTADGLALLHGQIGSRLLSPLVLSALAIALVLVML